MVFRLKRIHMKLDKIVSKSKTSQFSHNKPLIAFTYIIKIQINIINSISSSRSQSFVINTRVEVITQRFVVGNKNWYTHYNTIYKYLKTLYFIKYYEYFSGNSSSCQIQILVNIYYILTNYPIQQNKMSKQRFLEITY